MDGYQFDTFRCAAGIPIQKVARSYTAAELSCASYFFILCIKRLWDVVGHFLGCREQPAATPSARGFQPAQSVRRLRCYPVARNVGLKI
ncbi:hypothetical protein D3C86_1088310 [compost metagenome]